MVAGLGAGGTEMMCLRLAQFWQDRFEQHVLVLSHESGCLAEAFEAIPRLRVSIRPLCKRSRVQQFLWSRDIIRRVAPDVLLLHCFGVPHLLVAGAARTSSVDAMGVWAGNPPPSGAMARARFAAVVLASRALRCPIASCSGAVEQELSALNVGLPRRSRVLPNGIDVAAIRMPSDRSRQRREASCPVIGMVSRLDPIKDHATLLNAFSILLETVPAAQLWIVGDGPLRAHLEGRARDLGIWGSTRFFGNRTDIPELLGRMDVFAFSTTRDEGFGIALIEAMAALVAVIASDVPACREVLSGGQAGQLVEARSAPALAAALQDAISYPGERREAIDAATLHIEREYSIAACARRWEDMLFGARNRIRDRAACAS